MAKKKAEMLEEKDDIIEEVPEAEDTAPEAEAAAKPEKKTKKVDINELIERGKKKGSLSTEELDYVIEELDYDMESLDKLYDIDRWALSRLNKLIKTVDKAYNAYEFHVVYHEIVNFCTIDMSKLYIDITKDRLYVEAAASEGRRAAQTVLYEILQTLTKMIAPILAFTSDEIWQNMPHRASDNTEHVLLNDMTRANDEYDFAEIEAQYNKLFDLRDDVLKALEVARTEKLIGKSLEAKVEIYAEGETKALIEGFGEDLKSVFIVSGVKVEDAANAPADAFAETVSGIKVKVAVADGQKCDRCWMHSESGKTTEDGGFLCSRCLEIIGE